MKDIKAVGLVSGGLDSILAAKIIKDLGVEVYSIYFAMPWCCGDEQRARKIAEDINIRFVVKQLDDDYMEMLKNPKYGYGQAFNPCIDCHTYMIVKAGEFMRQIGAEFVFTGEVVGQRPMSQRKHVIRSIEKNCGLEGRLLRPLSAKILDPTIPEKEGLIDRNKLLDITGRSRKTQLKMAEQYNIKGFSAPAGGCLLTEKHFGLRIKDMLDHGYSSFKEAITLRWGKYFRINDDFSAILGRNERENKLLVEYAGENDCILEFHELKGPTILLKGPSPSELILKLCAGLIQRYSKYKNSDAQVVDFYFLSNKAEIHQIKADILSDEQIKNMIIE